MPQKPRRSPKLAAPSRPTKLKLSDPAVKAAVQEKFLAHLRETANISRSADFAGVTRDQFYWWKKEDPEFAKRWEEAWELGYDVLEQKCADRAFDGYLEPVFWQGVQVATIRKFSDSLAQFLLRGNKSGKFKDRVETENVNVNLNRHAHAALTDEELDGEIRRRLGITE
jgi:hypothetical protein